MLILSRGVNEQVVIEVNGEQIVVTVTRCRDGRVRLGFDAPRHALILRKELIEQGANHDRKNTAASARAGV